MMMMSNIIHSTLYIVIDLYDSVIMPYTGDKLLLEFTKIVGISALIYVFSTKIIVGIQIIIYSIRFRMPLSKYD